MGVIWFLSIVVLLIWGASISQRLSKIEKQLAEQSFVPVQPAQSFASQGVFAEPLPVPAPPQKQPSTNIGLTLNFEEFTSNWLTKIGVVALVVGVGFFLQYAIEQGWLGYWARILIGFGIGIALMILAEIWKNKYRNYALALSAGGLAVITFSVYAGASFYNLYSSYEAFALCFIVSVCAAVLAYRYKSYIYGSLGVALMMLSPVFFDLGGSALPFVVAYVLVLCISAVVIFRKFNILELLFLTFFGALINYLWYSSQFSDPANQVLTVSYILVVAFLYSVAAVWLIRQHQEKGNQPLLTIPNFDVSLAALEFLTGLFMLLAFMSAFQDKQSQAIFSLVSALILFIAYTIIDRLEHRYTNYALSIMGTIAALVAINVGLEGGELRLSVGLLLAAVILFAGHAAKRFELRVLGAIFIIIESVAVFGLQDSTAAFANTKFGLEALGAILLTYGAWLYQGESSTTEFEADAHKALTAIGALYFWIAVWTQISIMFRFDPETANLAASIWTLIWGVILIILSRLPAWQIYRKVAVGLFGFAILKVFLYDSSALDIPYRVVAFIVLGVILLAVSFAYQRNKEKITNFLKG